MELKSIENLAKVTLKSLENLEVFQSLSLKLSERCLDAYWDRHYATIKLASDQLSLDQKILIERSFKEKAPLEEGKEWHLFFKSLEKKRPPTPQIAKKMLSQKKKIPGVKHILVVSSGKGGVGKSTIGAYLTLALKAKGFAVGLLDADAHGPSVPTLFDIKHRHLKLTDDGLLIPVKKNGIQYMSFGFFSDEKNPLLWRGPLVSKYLNGFCFDTQWDHLDFLIIDFPPGTGDIPLSLCEKLVIDGALIVSTPQDLALIDAHKALSLFLSRKVPVLGLVENMSHHQCQNCGHKEDIFGDSMGHFAHQTSFSLLGKIPLQAKIRKSCDEGLTEKDLFPVWEKIVDNILFKIERTTH